ncbi:glutamate 5-kinase [Rhodothalassium salexigens DSM 2132]|uniref:Glutamate 5-kinase n=1 Tax=Rhodothalassium salexigens DSM 2132 TaxID=1188247 RepID=A0A4R2PNX3_RHOSA|nr:glutamate 5-kinase [Rhodothalassium salexigens]MBB4210864.1 glutamate 5-kinase [Rhodothalassium salexigens DSM 2132]MBK1639153.1 glutamate 5-kinase [Rhodothalassium salexigens DSM 2132]TCP36478.1 glutamate 5-kinase [Rhodothalassium salexigens DSM 2132]
MVAGLTGLDTCVVKVGSSLLVAGADGGPRGPWLDALAQDLVGRARRLVIVTSGAIALGRTALGLDRRPASLAEAQAAAAAGQIRLALAWSAAFAGDTGDDTGGAPHRRAGHRRTTAQVLLTLADLDDRRRYLNARDTLDALLGAGLVPVVNENDTVATDEIRFGDNDRLAARVAQVVGADLLVLLSDVDGLMDADPRRHPDARLIERVAVVDDRLRALAGPTGATGVGTGGMATKLDAADIATRSGTTVLLTSGLADRPLARYEATGRGTLFAPQENGLATRKQWLRGLQGVRGTLSVDAGAVRALDRGASLLPAGVTRVDGRFERGDPVRVAGPDGRALGQGLAGYGAADAAAIAGQRQDQIAQTLGYPARGPMIHRNDLVLFHPLRGTDP